MVLLNSKSKRIERKWGRVDRRSTNRNKRSVRSSDRRHGNFSSECTETPFPRCVSPLRADIGAAERSVFMVIQSMRFIDNSGTIPQVLKASSLSTLSSSPRSRGMHPIIGTLSVLPRGDNDAPLLRSLGAPNSLLHPPLRYPRRTWISIARKKSHLSIVRRVTRHARTESSGEESREMNRGQRGGGRRCRLPVFLPASASVAVLRRPRWLVRL